MYDEINTPLNNTPNKSKVKLVVAIVIMIFSILIIGFILLLTVTDTFKSNKELFFKYMGQVADEKEGFINKRIFDYFEKKQEAPYENQGEYKIELIPSDDDSQSSMLNEENIEKLNNMGISFSGKTDNMNSKNEKEINLNYSEEVNLPIKYKQTNSIYGIQSDCLTPKYISVDLSNVSDLLGMDINLESMTQLNFTDEEKKHIQDTYMEAINEQLPNEKFSKVEEIDSTGYTLTLTVNEIKNIYYGILEKIKDDQIILDKINSLTMSQENSDQIMGEDIQKIIDNGRQNEDSDDERAIEIIVYKKNKKLNKIGLNFKTNQEEQVQITIEKNVNDDNSQYKLSLATKKGSEDAINIADFSISYSGLKTMQNVNEQYVMSMDIPEEMPVAFNYELTNNVNFVDSVEIEDLSEENTLMLTDHSIEEVTSFMMQVGERLEEVNKQLSEQAGIGEDGNLIPVLIPFAMPIELYNQSQTTGILSASETALSENVRQEVRDRINTALNYCYAELLANMYGAGDNIMTPGNEEKILSESGLKNVDTSNGTYDVEVTDSYIKIKWTSEDGETIEGSINKTDEGQTRYEMTVAK